MSLFSGPTEHAANPPETWQVRKVGATRWGLFTQSGVELNLYSTKTAAEQSIALVWGVIYERETRWYAGEQIDHWKPWATVKAEREATVLRLAQRGRDGLSQRIERLTGRLRSDYRELSNDPMPADVVEWARWYAATYPGSVGAALASTVAELDAARAEVARTDALVADFAA